MGERAEAGPEAMSPADLNDFAKWVYLEELTHQAGHVAHAAKALARALQGMKRRGNEEVFFALHALLAAAGNISKLLWPPTGNDRPRDTQRAGRGSALRKSLRVSSDSILKDRVVRNDIEHYDERLDDFVATQVRRRSDRVVASRQVIAAAGLAPPQRAFDPETGVFSFQDHSVNIRDLAAETEAVAERAHRLLVKMGRE